MFSNHPAFNLCKIPSELKENIAAPNIIFLMYKLQYSCWPRSKNVLKLKDQT